MDSYLRRLPSINLPLRRDTGEAAGEIAKEAGTLVSRLIPFPGSESLAPLSLLPVPPRASGIESSSQPGSVPDIMVQQGQQAASIVSQAASILDEEMAKGLLAARRSSEPASYGTPDAGNLLLRQVHDFVDRVAAMWPGTPGPASPGSGASPLAAGDADGLADLRPRSTVKPGQRATITMTVRNNENRRVRLVPAATDLLGSAGGRIACSLLEFTPPGDFTLEPSQERDLTIAAGVPADAAPGCYSGLLVVRGAEYLRALITIDVAGGD